MATLSEVLGIDLLTTCIFLMTIGYGISTVLLIRQKTLLDRAINEIRFSSRDMSESSQTLNRALSFLNKVKVPTGATNTDPEASLSQPTACPNPSVTAKAER